MSRPLGRPPPARNREIVSFRACDARCLDVKSNPDAIIMWLPFLPFLFSPSRSFFPFTVWPREAFPFPWWDRVGVGRRPPTLGWRPVVAGGGLETGMGPGVGAACDALGSPRSGGLWRAVVAGGRMVLL